MSSGTVEEWAQKDNSSLASVGADRRSSYFSCLSHRWAKILSISLQDSLQALFNRIDSNCDGCDLSWVLTHNGYE